MINKRNNLIKRIIAAAFAIIMLVSVAAASGCSKNKPIKVPSGLTREEAALYVALATVCPKDDNNTKKEYLTFRFEGWSFGQQVPDAINEYIGEYCKSGNAQLMQFDDEGLEAIGILVVNDDPDSFYGVGDRVYAEGRGSILTFTLGDDQNTESDEVRVSFKKFISDSDTSGYDVELKREGDKWKCEGISGAWNQYQFFTPAPTDEDGPQK